MKKQYLLLFIMALLPLAAVSQGSGGEIRRQQQQSQPVRRQTQTQPQRQQAEAINYDSFNSALVQKAESGDAVAQYSLGLVYENGLGIEKNLSKAVEWYMLSANKGNANAQYHLGLCYENGSGIAKNMDSAYEWYQKASAQGMELAQNKVRLINEERQRQKEEENQENAKRDLIIQNLINNMVRVEGGTFTMGATKEQNGAKYDEKPTHQVTLSSFSIGKYEVTQEEWEAVMGSNPSIFEGAKKPVEQVSWDDCQAFISKLNELTGWNFRLPTEAEWEFAARGGTKSIDYQYAGSDNLGSVAWYTENSGRTIHEVGQKSPNELGLYDMSGNVREWCSDWYEDYSSSAQINPQGPSSGSYRVLRGGGWSSNAGTCRVSYRLSHSPWTRYNDLGFRLAFPHIDLSDEDRDVDEEHEYVLLEDL